MFVLRAFATGLLMLAAKVQAAGVPGDCTQLIVGIAPSWNAMRGELRLFETYRLADEPFTIEPTPEALKAMNARLH
jgi:hypothetical protein